MRQTEMFRDLLSYHEAEKEWNTEEIRGFNHYLRSVSGRVLSDGIYSLSSSLTFAGLLLVRFIFGGSMMMKPSLSSQTMISFVDSASYRTRHMS